MNAQRPDHDTVRSAIELATRAPSVHNTQPWRWLLGEHSVHLMADWTRQVPVTDPDGRDLVVSCGAALHHLRVALAALGWEAHVHRLPNPTDPEHLAAIEMHPRTPTAEDVAAAAAIIRRRTDRRRYSSWPVPAEHLELLVRQAAVEGAFAVPVLGPLARHRLTTTITAAADEQEARPGYELEMVAWSGRGTTAPEGVLTASAEPGEHRHGDVRMRGFAAGSLASSTSGPGEQDAAELVVVATSGDDTIARLRAGEAASAVLLAATDLGLATCPLSQPLEIAALRTVVRDEVLDGAGEPQLVIRVGWAPVAAEPLPRSPRRDVDEVAAFLPGAVRVPTARRRSPRR